MQSAPPTMFPAVTTTRFRAKPAHDTRCGSCGKKRPMEGSVMLATLCSKPAPMKANRHQKISKRRAVSSFARMPIHTARQTSALQRMARKNSSRSGAWAGLCRGRPALVRAPPAIALTVPCSTGSSRARLARHEDPPALDADLVGGDAHARVVETLARPQVETLLVDRRSDLPDSTAVADDSTGEDERLAEGIEVADGVDGVTGPDDGYLLTCDERADAGAREHVVERANVLPGFLRRALDGDRVHPTASRKSGAFSCQVAGRCWARWRICTRLGSGAAEFTKVRKRDSFAGSSMVAFHSHR